MADTDNGFTTLSPDEESLLTPIRSDDVMAMLDAGRTHWPKHHSPLDYTEAYGQGFDNAVANDAHHLIDHHPLTTQSVEDRFHFMVETALFLNSSFS